MTNYDTIMKLSLERGFYFPSSEIYSDAPAGFWDYGPNGVNLKNKFIELWRRELIRRDGMVEIDGSQIMSKSVFKASGHIDNFSDPVIKCIKCNHILRADKFINEKIDLNIPEGLKNEDIDAIILKNQLLCPSCKSKFKSTERFNMMFKVEIGPNKDEAYLRPETCQTIFVDFSRIFKVMRGRFPFAVAQIGKSFRNEIAPRQSLLRLREFYQAEIEIFCNPNKLNSLSKFEEIKDTNLRIQIDSEINEIRAEEAWKKKIIPNKLIGYYLSLLALFYEKTGIDMKKTRFRKLADDEKAFYANIAFDFEVGTSLGWLELVACNYRSDYDLKQHSSLSKEKMEVIDPDTQQKILPHVFELSLGIDRSIYTILEHSFFQDTDNKRTVLRLNPHLAPISIGILPLMRNEDIENISRRIHDNLKRNYDTFYDASGSIGRRYRRLEEIGVPYAITIDHTSKTDNTVTIRYRDTMEQTRIKIDEIKDFFAKSI